MPNKEFRTPFYGTTPTTTLPADKITYDNTDSGLTASDVQNAIDEIDTNVDTITTTLNSLIKYATLTATTSSNSTIELGYNNRLVINANVKSNKNYMAIPMMYERSASSQHENFLKIAKYSDFSALATTEITVEYWYIDMPSEDGE